MSASSKKRGQKDAARRQTLRSRRATMTQAQQEYARTQRDINRQLSGWSRRRIAAWALFGLALVIVVQHLLAHSGWQPLPFSMGWQDLLLGYPMAGLLAIVGAFMLEARRHRP